MQKTGGKRKKAGMRRWSADRLTFFVITLPALALYSFFYMYSVIMGVSYSLTDWDGLSRKYSYIGFANYAKILGNRRFYDSSLITLRYAFWMVVVTIILGVCLAVALNSVRKCRTVIRSVFFFPAMISAVAVALIWDQVFYRGAPSILSLIGLGEGYASPFGSKTQALYAILFVNLWQSLAMPTVIFLAGLQSIPDELYESAVIDGATMWDKFRFVTLPYLVPTITVNAIMTLKSGITAFDYAFTLTKGGPARSSMLIGIKIYQDAFGDTPNFSIANTEAVLLFLVIAAISAVQLVVSNRSGVNNT